MFSFCSYFALVTGQCCCCCFYWRSCFVWRWLALSLVCLYAITCYLYSCANSCTIWYLLWWTVETIAYRVEATASRPEAIAVGMEAIAVGMEAIALGMEAIAFRPEAIAVGMEAIAVGMEALATRVLTLVFFLCCCGGLCRILKRARSDSVGLVQSFRDTLLQQFLL